LHDRPSLVVELLRADLGLPDGPCEVRLYPADLTNLDPAVRRADAVVLLDTRGRRVAIIGEIQLSIDPEKLFTWPAYLMDLRARVRHDVVLLVIAPDPEVAAWARKPIRIDAHTALRVHVVGLGDVTPPPLHQATSCDPALAVLASILRHGRPDEADAAHAALLAAATLDDERGPTYADMVWAALSAHAAEILEERMRTTPHEFQSDFARKYYGLGLAEGEQRGREEGREEEARTVLRRLLYQRFGSLDASQEARLEAADRQTLERFAERILSADAIDTVLA
jgi:hypothetical protein